MSKMMKDIVACPVCQTTGEKVAQKTVYSLLKGEARK